MLMLSKDLAVSASPQNDLVISAILAQNHHSYSVQILLKIYWLWILCRSNISYLIILHGWTYIWIFWEIFAMSLFIYWMYLIYKKVMLYLHYPIKSPNLLPFCGNTSYHFFQVIPHTASVICHITFFAYRWLTRPLQWSYSMYHDFF